MRYLYSLLFYFTLPLIYFRLWWKGKKNPAYRQGWAQRLGYIHLPPRAGNIWLHAVSVGELIAARPFIQALLKAYPEKTLCITSMTATGFALASQLCNERVSHAYLPYDLPDAVQRFLDRLQPQMAIIMETELWPNLVHYTAEKKIPILLANARLSPRSAAGYQRILPLISPLLAKINIIAAQTQAEAERFIALGALREQVVVAGNIKFDVPVPEDLVAAGRALRTSWGEKRPVVIAASTHAGEEEQVLSAFSELRKTWPTALLILVPRHQERFDAVAALCVQQNYKIVRRSTAELCEMDTQIFVGDSLGELFLYYAAADVAFVGGSFVPVGGHNLLEPAAIGLPSISGPNLFNFTEIFKLLHEADATIKVADAMELAKVWSELLQDEARCQKMGAQGQKVVAQNRGALQKHLKYVEQRQFPPL